MSDWEYGEWKSAVAALNEMDRAEWEPDDSDRYGWGVFDEQEREVDPDDE